MTFTVSVSSSSSTPSSLFQTHINRQTQCFSSQLKLNNRFQSIKSPSLLRLLLPPPLASRRVSGANNNNIIDDHRIWSRSINSDFFNDLNRDDEDEDEEEEEEEEDRSLDLLVRFIENIFKKLSKRARKAVRSVLPVSISSKLVAFSVNGVLMLAFLWVLKAFLEVVCTLGSVVFVSILMIRGVWSGITYLQESRFLKMNELDDDHHAWTGAQPAA